MKPGHGQLRGIPDVMEPRCRHQVIGQGELLRDPPGPPSYGPDMPPASRQNGGKQLFAELGSIFGMDHDPDSTASAGPSRQPHLILYTPRC